MMHPLSRRRKSSVVFRHLVASTPTAATAVEPARAARYTGAANASWLATAATPMAIGSACRATTTARAVTRPPSAAAGTRLRCGPNTRTRAPTAAFASRSQALGRALPPNAEPPKQTVHPSGRVHGRHPPRGCRRIPRSPCTSFWTRRRGSGRPTRWVDRGAPEREQRLWGMDLHAARGPKWGTA